MSGSNQLVQVGEWLWLLPTAITSVNVKRTSHRDRAVGGKDFSMHIVCDGKTYNVHGDGPMMLATLRSLRVPHTGSMEMPR